MVGSLFFRQKKSVRFAYGLLMLPKCKQDSLAIHQSNDTSCFGGPKGNASKHNKSAKRHSSRIRRRLDKQEINSQQ